jgi:hypothetical protein
LSVPTGDFLGGGRKGFKNKIGGGYHSAKNKSSGEVRGTRIENGGGYPSAKIKMIDPAIRPKIFGMRSAAAAELIMV